LISVRQGAEPEELVFILGGRIAIRQGTRAHWTVENTTMHVVRGINGSIYIDELDLNVKNLCSGYSYCLSLIGTVYVWYGTGSIPQERKAALEYAQNMTSGEVTELVEGESDDDEMFWLMLGEREYANADYWKWRVSGGGSVGGPRIWKVDGSKGFHFIPALSSVDSLHDFVFVFDCIWEYFVLIGREARGKRSDIKVALSVAADMAFKTSSVKPFTPTVHVLVLPTQIPCDLRIALRDIDEVHLNAGDVPDHMNLIPASEALQQLHQTVWERSVLKDPSMLPVGLHPSLLEGSP